MMPTLVLIGLLVAVFLWVRLRRRTRASGGRLMPEGLVRVGFDGGEIVCSYPDGALRKVAWDDVSAVRVRTTSDGPWSPDVFWGIWGIHSNEHPAIVYPGGCTGDEALLEAMQKRLPNFDNEALIRAMGCTSDRSFVVWEARRPLT